MVIRTGYGGATGGLDGGGDLQAIKEELEYVTANQQLMSSAEGVFHFGTDLGIPPLAVRKVIPGNLAAIDGEYEFLQIDEGRLWVQDSVLATLITAGNVDLDAMEVLITAGNVDLAAMEVLLGTIDADTAAMVTDLAAIEVLITAGNVDLDAMEVLITAGNVDLAAMEVLLGTIDADMALMVTDLAAIEVLLGTIDADTALMVTDLAAMEVLITAGNVDLAAMEVLITAGNVDLAAMEVVLGSIYTKINTINLSLESGGDIYNKLLSMDGALKKIDDWEDAQHVDVVKTVPIEMLTDVLVAVGDVGTDTIGAPGSGYHLEVYAYQIQESAKSTGVHTGNEAMLVFASSGIHLWHGIQDNPAASEQNKYSMMGSRISGGSEEALTLRNCDVTVGAVGNITAVVTYAVVAD